MYALRHLAPGSQDFVPFVARSSAIRPFAIAAAATKVTRKANADGEGTCVRVTIPLHLLFARRAGVGRPDASTLDEEGVHVRVPLALNLLKAYPIRDEHDGSALEVQDSALKRIFRVRGELSTTYVDPGEARPLLPYRKKYETLRDY